MASKKPILETAGNMEPSIENKGIIENENEKPQTPTIIPKITFKIIDPAKRRRHLEKIKERDEKFPTTLKVPNKIKGPIEAY